MEPFAKQLRTRGARCAGLLVLVALFAAVIPRDQAAAQAATAAEKPCLVADALNAAGETDAARRVYRRLLSDVPAAMTCAAAGLRSLNGAPSAGRTAAEQLCAVAARLDDAGFEDEALAAYRRALERDPAASCAIEGVDPDTPVSEWLDAPLDWIAGHVPAVVLLLLAAWIVARAAARVRWLRERAVRWPVTAWAFRPRLTINPFGDAAYDGKVGEALTAHVREQLHRFAEDAKGDGEQETLDFRPERSEVIDLVAGSDAVEAALAKAGEASDHMKLIAALASFAAVLLPKQRFVVDGVLLPADGSTVSVTVNVTTGSAMRGAWRAVAHGSEEGAAGDADCMRLAVPVAAWTRVTIAQALGTSRGRKAFGADAAASAAHNRQGLEAQRAKQWVQARAAYRQAMDTDQDNWEAYSNSALMEARLGDFEAAIAILETGLRRMESGRAESDR